MKKLLFMLLCFPMIVFAQLKVAILDFENTSGIDKYDGLGKAMSNMLITDLRNNIHPSKIVFMERSQLNKILDEQNLQKSKNFDNSTAVNFGKLAGVDFIIIGSVYVLDKHCNITSRMVNVETSQIKHSKEVDGSINNWMTLKSNLAQEFAEAVNNPISIKDPDQTTDFGVLVQYSKILNAIDKKQIEQAKEMIEMMKDLGISFNYIDLLSEEMEEIKEKIKSIDTDIQELQLTTRIIKEDLAELRRVLNEEVIRFIKTPKSAKDFLSNIHYHNHIKKSDYKTRIEAYDQLFSNYQINFLDIYLDYFNLLNDLDYSETYDNDYTSSVERINKTIEKSCSDKALKEFLLLIFPQAQIKLYVSSIFRDFSLITFKAKKEDKERHMNEYYLQRNQHIINNYNLLLEHFRVNQNHNFIKSLWLSSIGDVNRLLKFSNNIESYDLHLRQCHWIENQIISLSNIDIDFDYKDIDSYFLNKSNAILYIKEIQDISISYNNFFNEYNLANFNENWNIDSWDVSKLFGYSKVVDAINWKRNYITHWYPGAIASDASTWNIKAEGGTIYLGPYETGRSFTGRDGCSTGSRRCWHGRVTSYFKNGNISAIRFYSDGQRTSTHTFYNKNGVKEREEDWYQDEMRGTYMEQVDARTPSSGIRFYHKNGQLKAERIYEISRYKKEFKCWNENGKEIDCKKYENQLERTLPER